MTHLVCNVYGNMQCLLVRYGDVIIHSKPTDTEIYFVNGTRKGTIRFLKRLVYDRNTFRHFRDVRLESKGGKPIPLDSDDSVKLIRGFNGSAVNVLIDAVYVLNSEEDCECLTRFCDYLDDYLKRAKGEVLSLLVRDMTEIVTQTSNEEDGVACFPIIKVLLVGRDHRITESEWNYYDSVHKMIPGTFYTPPLPASSYLYTVSYYTDEKIPLKPVLDRLGDDVTLLQLKPTNG